MPDEQKLSTIVQLTWEKWGIFENNNPTAIENQIVVGLNRGPTWA